MSGPGTGPTTTATGPAVTLEKSSVGEIHHHQLVSEPSHHHIQIQHQQNNPMDLAPRGTSVVQLRPVRPVFSTIQTHGTTLVGTKTQVGSMGQAIATVSAGTPIISVNRTTPANVTLLPARAATGAMGQGQVTGPTYQMITRVGNVRPTVVGTQPASITVTPISASNLGANIRLSGATVNNGTWIQATGGGPAAFSPIRAATITVGGRGMRPDGKMIHIPQQGSVQHVGQVGYNFLQMVDSKGSILKPQLTTTPIVNIRGTLPGGANSGTSVIPIPPFTIRTANITTIQQRPPTSTSANQVHKVITPGHGAPIQFVNANKNPHVIQAITPIPKLSTVCLTISTNANLAPNNSSPVVAVASRQGGTPSLIMTPSAAGGALPITKVYPVGRDGSSIVEFAPHSSSGGGNSVTVSAVSVSTTGVHSNPTSVVVATPHSGGGGQSHSQHVVVHTPTINVHTAGNANAVGVGLPPPNLAPGSIAPGYYVDKNFSMNLVPAQTRPISLEKKIDAKGLPPGSMIFTTTHPAHLHHSGGGGGHPGGTTVTIPLNSIAPHGTQHLNISHTLPLGHQSSAGGQNHHSLQQQQGGTTQILTQIQPGTPHHHITSSMLTAVSTPSITVTGPTNHQQQGHNVHPLVGISSSSSSGHVIPTHVISQSVVNSSSSSNTNNNNNNNNLQTTGSVLTVTTTTISSNNNNNGSNTSTTANSNIINNNLINSSLAVTSTSSVSSSSSSVSTTTTSNTGTTTSNSSTTTNSSSSTAPPAQSPNQSNKSTHSPRPSILRKRELGDSHLSSRAQRNLTHSLNFVAANNNNNNNSNNNNNPGGGGPSSIIPNFSTTVANKENNSLSLEKFSSSSSNIISNFNISGSGGANTSSGVSILKKEFQPPTEESSWQSVSSNSSSGSSTISTTSETAELQMQQQQLSSSVGAAAAAASSVSSGLVNMHCGEPHPPNTSLNSFAGGITNSNSNNINNSNNSSSSLITPQNGVVRTAPPSSAAPNNHGRSRSSSTSKASNKDLDRLKSKDKDLDAVSPRKKPRKQQLTSSELLESASPEIYYQGKGKRFRKRDLMDFSDGIVEKIGIEPIPEEPPPPRVVYYLKKPHMSLMQFNSIPPKSLTTHFQRYCDVKPKDEKRPTINDLANQNGIFQKVSGWRVQHMTAQMEELVEGENNVVSRCSSLLSRLEVKAGPNCHDRDLNNVLELLKGNIQRCKVIRDQMSESKVQALKIIEHKPHILEVINKYSSKRPKKRDRLL